MTELQMMQARPLISHSSNSPSFNTYSSGALAEIAVRVVQEFAEDDIFSSWKDQDTVFLDNHDDDDFEFAFVCKEPATSPVSADEIFFNGKIKPLYDPSAFFSPKPARLPLGKLFKEEKRESESTESCSSSESGELEGVPSESYCVWTPRTAEGECKKSNSTGSSKRWKLRDLLYRSHSDGKDRFTFLAAAGKKGRENKVDNSKEGNDMKMGGNDRKKDSKMDTKEEGNDSVVEDREVKSSKKVGGKRRTLLPYRQELVGICSSNANGGSFVRG